MYFIRYQPLKEKLRERSLSDREALPYLVVFSLSAFASALFPTTTANNIWDYISLGISISLVICGVIYAFKMNGGSQGYDLVQKYVVIGWIAIVRCTIAFIPLLIPLLFFADFLEVTPDETNWFDVLILTVFQIVLYQRIGRHIKDTK
jgi:uncharacterized membrane protein